MSAIRERVSELRSEGFECGSPLTHGRSCVKTRGHKEMILARDRGIVYDSRHSHTWHMGDARLGVHGEKLVNLESGEVIGDSLEDRDLSPFRPGPEHSRFEALNVLWIHLPGFARALNEREGESVSMANGEVIQATWHYNSGDRSFGVTSEGHDVVRDNHTGRITRIYSVNQKRGAIESASVLGLSSAARKLDIPKPTVQAWMTRGAV